MINFNPRKRVFDKCTVLIVVEKVILPMIYGSISPILFNTSHKTSYIFKLTSNSALRILFYGSVISK